MAAHWTPSTLSISSWKWDAQSWRQYSRWDHTRATERKVLLFPCSVMWYLCIFSPELHCPLYFLATVYHMGNWCLIGCLVLPAFLLFRWLSLSHWLFGFFGLSFHRWITLQFSKINLFFFFCPCCWFPTSLYFIWSKHINEVSMCIRCKVH